MENETIARVYSLFLQAEKVEVTLKCKINDEKWRLKTIQKVNGISQDDLIKAFSKGCKFKRSNNNSVGKTKLSGNAAITLAKIIFEHKYEIIWKLPKSKIQKGALQ